MIIVEILHIVIMKSALASHPSILKIAFTCTRAVSLVLKCRNCLLNFSEMTTLFLVLFRQKILIP